MEAVKHTNSIIRVLLFMTLVMAVITYILMTKFAFENMEYYSGIDEEYNEIMESADSLLDGNPSDDCLLVECGAMKWILK